MSVMYEDDGWIRIHSNDPDNYSSIYVKLRDRSILITDDVFGLPNVRENLTVMDRNQLDQIHDAVSSRDTPFKVGDLVYKDTGDYEFTGIVRAVMEKEEGGGEFRYVCLETTPGATGKLMIMHERQLKHVGGMDV